MGVRSLRVCALAVLAASVVMAASSAASADLQIIANEDTYTYQASAGTNYNGQGLLVKSQTGARRSSWVEFLLGTSPVSSAVFNLYLYTIPSGWGSSHTVQIYGAQYDMNETTLTQSTAPSTTGWASLPGWTASATSTWYSSDITSFYNANLGAIVTLKITQSDSNSVGGAYEDSEGHYGTTNYPYISIVPVPEPAGVLALVSGLAGFGGLGLRRRS